MFKDGPESAVGFFGNGIVVREQNELRCVSAGQAAGWVQAGAHTSRGGGVGWAGAAIPAWKVACSCTQWQQQTRERDKEPGNRQQHVRAAVVATPLPACQIHALACASQQLACCCRDADKYC